MLELSQKQSLEQRLSPQQILLSTLLQLPSLSLEQRIKQEIEINPVLEENIDDEMDDTSQELSTDEDNEDEEDDEILDRLEKEEDIDWEKVEVDEDSYERSLPKDPNIEEYVSQDAISITPQEKLIKQLHFVTTSQDEQEIGEYIIWNLRDDGYLDEQMNLETIAHIHDTSVKNVESILKKVQRFEPKAMGARNLRECLMIQLEDKFGEINLLAYDILRFAFEELVNKKFERIATIVEDTLDNIKKALHSIEKLNPKPGEGFFNQKTNYITPDFFVERQENEFIVTMNDWNSPGLHISEHYRNILANQNTDKKTKGFIRKKVEAAKWFITSVERRKITLLKVMNALVEKQYHFFSKGPQFIQPLIMKEIADVIEMDISTVSRVVNRKYVQTEYGIFELRSFFTEKMETLEGETVSTRIIKQKLLELCEKEHKRKPMSDALISKELNTLGFKVARRTVAKYREQLGIPVARLRREII